MSVVDARVKKGSLTLAGEEFSCQPTNVTIAPDHDDSASSDPVEVLCGETLIDATSSTLTANLTVTAIQDFSSPDGFQAFAWANDNHEVDFTWNPTDNTQDEWSGSLVPQALVVGGDVGARITSDAEWKITQLTTPQRFGAKTVIGSGDGTVTLTGVSAGSPGSFAPVGAPIPADLTALKANTVVGDSGSNKPVAAWTTGQYVDLGDASDASWDGTAWVTGAAA